MSDVDLDEFDLPMDEDEGNGEEESQANGSKGLKNLRAAHRKAQKENEELKKELAELRSGLRKSTVADLLEAKGANKKLSKFVLADVGDSELNAEFVDNWLNENGELFGYEPAGEEGSDEQREQFERAANTERNGSPSGQTREELHAQLRELDVRDPEFQEKKAAIYTALSSIR